MARTLAWLAAAGLVTVAWAGFVQGGPGLAAEGPGASVARLLAAHGMAADPAALAALDALPGPVGQGLAGVVDAYAAYEAATAAAFGGVDLGLVQAWQAGAQPPPATAAEAWSLAGFDPAPVRAAQDALHAAGLALARAAAAQAALPPVRLAVPPVLAIDTVGLDDVYPDNLALVVDFGGNDVYRNNAGGSNLLGVCISQLGPGAGALLDLAGNDAYVGPARACGINGGASTGAGFLLDMEGDDVYATDVDIGNKAVNGGGAWLGVGFLEDRAGNDAYTAGGWGTNGGGYIGGTGMLRDLGGDDAYTASFDGVNGGGSGGLGMLLDEGGRDLYREGCDWFCTAFWDQTIVPKDTVGAQMDL